MGVDPATAKQIEAAYSAIRSALLILDGLLVSTQESEKEAIIPIPECRHRNTENATTMGQEPRRLCKECMSYLYPDGRVEPLK